MREEGLLNGLKVSSKTYQPITCYQVRARQSRARVPQRQGSPPPRRACCARAEHSPQISDKGLEVVRRLPKADKDAIHEVVYKEMNVRNLTHPIWNSELCQYYMLPEGTTDFTDVTPSSVMRCESVSYVSSAYVPQCLRYSGRPTLSNAHRANESAVGATSLRDELDEVRGGGARGGGGGGGAPVPLPPSTPDACAGNHAQLRLHHRRRVHPLRRKPDRLHEHVARLH